MSLLRARTMLFHFRRSFPAGAHLSLPFAQRYVSSMADQVKVSSGAGEEKPVNGNSAGLVEVRMAGMGKGGRRCGTAGSPCVSACLSLFGRGEAASVMKGLLCAVVLEC